MDNLGLIIAVPDEAKDILSNDIFGWQEVKPNLFVSQNYNLRLILGGVGKVNAAFALAQIIDDCDTIFTIGTAGGMGSEPVGSIYIATEFVEHDMDASGLGVPVGVTPYAEDQDHIISSCNSTVTKNLEAVMKANDIAINYGRMISGDQFIADPVLSTQKREIFQASMVDMESAGVAKLCKRAGKNILTIRYISDNANHDSGIDWVENVKRSSTIMNNILTELATKQLTKKVPA